MPRKVTYVQKRPTTDVSAAAFSLDVQFPLQTNTQKVRTKPQLRKMYRAKYSKL